MAAHRTAPSCNGSLSARISVAIVAGCFLAHSASTFAAEAVAEPLPSNSVFRSAHVISKTGRLWEVEQIRPSSPVNAVAQDTRGYLWLATRGDLLRSDGAQFVSFAEPLRRTLGSSDVSAVINGPDDAITVALTNGQIGSVHSDGSIKQRFLLPEKPQTGFARDTDGSLVIATATSIHHTTATSIAHVNVTATVRLWSTHDHHVLAETTDALVGDGPVHVPLPVQQSGRSVAILHALYPSMLTTGVDLVKQLSGRVLKASYTDAEGDLWLGLNQGLLWIHDDSPTVFSAEDGLPGSDVEAIVGDREGNVWITTYGGGLCRLRPASVRTLGFRDGMQGEVPFALAHAPEAGLVITTSAGLSVLDATGFRNFNFQNGLPTHSVRSAQNYPNGDILMATFDRTLVRFQVYDKTFSTVAVPAFEKQSAGVTALTRLANGDFAIGIGDGQLLRMHERDFVQLRPAVCRNATDRTCAEGIRAVVEYEGALWLGTENAGLLEHSEHKAQTGPLLSARRIETLFNDGQGGLWVAAGGNTPELYLRKHGQLRLLPFSEQVEAMVADDSGAIWAGTNNGIFRLSPSPLDGAFAVRKFGFADGLVSEEVIGSFAPTALRTADGHLWFATLGGLVQIDPKAAARTIIAPLPVIESFETDQHRIAIAPTQKQISVGPGSGTVRVNFTAPALARHDLSQLQYRLSPLESQWQPANGTRRASYLQLPAGPYTFELRTLANAGKPATVTFFLLPHFYETLWFRVCLVAFAIVVLFTAYRFRTRQGQQRQTLILAERARVARDLHDTLAQVFAALGLQIDRVLARTNGVDAQSELSHVRQMITHARIAARGAIFGMRDGAIRDLSQAMQELKDSFAPFQVVIHTEGESVRATAAVESEICFLVQEAVANAIEHGRATHATIEINARKSVVTVRVRDNGSGFTDTKDSKLTSGMGMRVMHERARRLKGTLLVHTEKDVGTEVELELPRKPHFS